ncbi:hypothetical protein EV2_031786 [Malus domestica]
MRRKDEDEVYGKREQRQRMVRTKSGTKRDPTLFRPVPRTKRDLKQSSKKIDGRMTVTQLASAGNSNSNTASNNVADISLRNIYVANVPYDMPLDKHLAHFALYGEIEEGPLGLDKQTGKCKGYALFVYKTLEGAQAALVDHMKNIEGRQLTCKLAIDGQKGKSVLVMSQY